MCFSDAIRWRASVYHQFLNLQNKMSLPNLILSCFNAVSMQSRTITEYERMLYSYSKLPAFQMSNQELICVRDSLDTVLESDDYQV